MATLDTHTYTPQLRKAYQLIFFSTLSFFDKKVLTLLLQINFSALFFQIWVHAYFFQIRQTKERSVGTFVGNMVTITISASHLLDLPFGIIADQVRKKITNFVIEFMFIHPTYS